MREYVFIVKKECDGEEPIRKALCFKELEQHLNEGWIFNTSSDKTVYQALYNFYMVMKNDTN